MMDDAGVIGYWARNLHPAAAAPRPIAWLPVIRSFGAPRRESAWSFTLAFFAANSYPSLLAPRFQSTISPAFLPNESVRTWCRRSSGMPAK